MCPSQPVACIQVDSEHFVNNVLNYETGSAIAFADLQLISSRDETISCFPVNAALLACCSPLIYRLLRDAHLHDVCIVLDDVDRETLRSVVDLVYSGRTQTIDDGNGGRDRRESLFATLADLQIVLPYDHTSHLVTKPSPSSRRSSAIGRASNAEDRTQSYNSDDGGEHMGRTIRSSRFECDTAVSSAVAVVQLELNIRPHLSPPPTSSDSLTNQQVKQLKRKVKRETAFNDSDLSSAQNRYSTNESANSNLVAMKRSVITNSEVESGPAFDENSPNFSDSDALAVNDVKPSDLLISEIGDQCSIRNGITTNNDTHTHPAEPLTDNVRVDEKPGANRTLLSSTLQRDNGNSPVEVVPSSRRKRTKRLRRLSTKTPSKRSNHRICRGNGAVTSQKGSSAVGEKRERGDGGNGKGESGGGAFRCGVCPRKFSSSDQLSDHKNTFHAVGRSLVCDFCQLKCENWDQLLQHRKKVHGMITFSCGHCGKLFRWRNNFNRHVDSHREIKRFVCDKCPLSFANRERLEQHVNAQHLGITYTCQRCGRKLTNENCFRKHICQDKPKPFSCSECPSQFSKKDSLERHMNLHTQAQVFHCQMENCGKIFYNIYSFKSHSSTHDASAQCVCQICHKVLSCKSGLKKHMEVHAPEQRRPRKFPCSFCELICTTNSELVKHTRIHTGERPYVCDLCGKSFSVVSSLKLHMVYHKSKEHECSLCKKLFYTRKTLHDHIRTHTGEKPFTCIVCSKCFTSTTLLSLHRRIHKNKKPV